MRPRMHANEVPTDVALVRALLVEQLPQWAELPLELVQSYGTDHDVYRLGDELCVRLPRIGWASGQAAKEGRWLPRLAPALPLAVPEQLAMGRPGQGYPFAWSVCTWLPGENAHGTIDDLEAAATDLAAFIEALQGIGTHGAPERPVGARGGPLSEGDDDVLAALDRLGVRVDARAVLAVWQEALAAPAWDRAGVWVHGDLSPGNLLVVDGRLAAVIDFGSLNVGDPACDLQPAWNVFTGPSRQRFREALDVDDATWLRGRGWVVRQTVLALPYYWDTNPGIVRQASYALDQVLSSR